MVFPSCCMFRRFEANIFQAFRFRKRYNTPVFVRYQCAKFHLPVHTIGRRQFPRRAYLWFSIHHHYRLPVYPLFKSFPAMYQEAVYRLQSSDYFDSVLTNTMSYRIIIETKSPSLSSCFLYSTVTSGSSIIRNKNKA